MQNKSNLPTSNSPNKIVQKGGVKPLVDGHPNADVISAVTISNQNIDAHGLGPLNTELVKLREESALIQKKLKRKILEDKMLSTESLGEVSGSVSNPDQASSSSEALILAQASTGVISDTEPSITESFKRRIASSSDATSSLELSVPTLAPEVATPASVDVANAGGISTLGWVGIGVLAVGAAAAGGGGSGGGHSSVADTTAPTYKSMTVHSNGGGAGTIVMTFDSVIDAAHLPAASAFSVTISGITQSPTTVSASGSELTLTFSSGFIPSGAYSLTLSYTDPTASDDVAAIQDAAGNDVANITITQGIVADGYIRGAQMYLDAPSGLQILTGVITDQSGNFFLANGSNPNGYALVAVGGVNIDTGLPNATLLKAPAGSTTVNPLTTLVQAVASASGISASEAATQVATSLNLTSSLGGVSLLNYDPLSSSSAANTIIQKAAAQVATIVALAVSESANNTAAASLANAVISNIATSIVNAVATSTTGATVTVSLSDSSTISQALSGTSVSTAIQSSIADATSSIQSAVSVAAITASQSKYLDTVAPDAPTALTIAVATNDITPTIRVSLNTTSMDGKAVVVNDKVMLIENGSQVGTATVSATDISNRYVDISVDSALSQGSHSFTAKIIDQAGNSGVVSAAASTVIDTTAPTVSIKSSAEAIAVGQTVLLTITFSEEVSGFSVADISIPTGAKLGTLSVAKVLSDGSVQYTVNYTAPTVGGVGTVLISSATYTDVAGNNGLISNSLDLSAVNPPVVVIKSIGSGGDTIVSSVSGDKVIKGIGDPSLEVTIKSGSNTLGAATADLNGIWSYTLTSENISTLGQGANTLTAQQSKVGGVVGTSADFNISVDTVAPANPTINAITTDDLINASEKALGVDITGTAEAGSTIKLSIAGSTKLATVDGSGNWQYRITDADYKSLGTGGAITATSVDAAGNTSISDATRTITVDTVAPSLTSFSLNTASDTGTVGDGLTKIAASTIQFKAESGSTVDVYVANVRIGSAIESGTTGNFTYTFAVDALSVGSNTVKLVAADSHGNSSSRTGVICLDPLAPTVVITDDESGTGNIAGGIITYTFTFSEPVTGFAASDITVANGSKGSFTAVSPTVYSLVVTPLANFEGNLTVDVSVAKAIDAAGNDNLAATQNIQAIDTLPPTVAITSSVAAVKAGQTSAISFTFSEDPSSTFTSADVALVGGTLGTITGTGLTRTATFTPTENYTGNASITVTSASYTDTAGNTGGAGTTPTLAIDTLPPTISPYTPADNGNSLGLASNLILHASETVTKGSGSVSLYKADGTLIESISVSSSRVVITGTDADSVISIDPSSDLVKDQQYYVQASTGSFLDSAGNSWAGIANNTSWNFTGAGAALTISAVATDNKVNATEAAAGFTVSGTVSAEAAILAQYLSSDLVVKLRPSSGSDITLTNPVFSYTSGTSSTWSVDVPQNTLSGDKTYTVVATITGTSGVASGVVGESTQSITIDTTAPTVSSVAITGATGALSSTLNAGDVVAVTVTMSEAVAISGTPQLALNVGDITVQAAYASGSGTTTLVFNYTILANQTDANGISIASNSLALNSGTILDLAGNTATITHSAVLDNASYKVDTTAPTVSSIVITGATGIANSTLNAGDVVVTTVTVSEAVAVTGSPQLALNIGGTSVQATYDAVNSTSTALKFNYTILAGQADAGGISVDANSLALNSGTILDLAGNAATIIHSAVTDNTSYKVDTTAPVISSITYSSFNAVTGYLTYVITSDSAIDWSSSSSTVGVTGGSVVTAPTTSSLVNSVYESTIVVQPTASITSVSLIVSATPADSVGNAGTQVSSVAKTVLETTASGVQTAVTLLGSSGNDLLYTGHNGDILVGGAGADAIYIKSGIAATVKLLAASNSVVGNNDTVTGFGSDDTLDISAITSAAGYTALTAIPTGTFTSSYTFENASVDQATHIATADVVYHGSAVKGLGSYAAFEMALNTFGNTASISNEISTGNWSIYLSDGVVQGVSFITSTSTTVLSEGQRLFTISYQLESNDSSFLFSSSSVKIDVDAHSIDNITPVFTGLPNSSELVYINDGTTLGTVTDNTLHFAQDADGVHIKYDTNSTSGMLSQSAEIYIAGITDPIQHLTVL